MIVVEHMPAGALEAEAVRGFLKESAAAYPKEVGTPDLDEWPQKMAQFADCFCVRRSDGTLAAALFAYLNDMVMRVGYVPFICVLPGCGKDTAYRLHESYRACAQQIGMTSLMLEVLKSNVHAMAFYARQGYEVVADRDENGRWLLCLSLSSDESKII